MTGDARRALTRLLNAFENHFDIARDGDEADDAALEAAELALRDAFFTYDDILFTSWAWNSLSTSSMRLTRMTATKKMRTTTMRTKTRTTTSSKSMTETNQSRTRMRRGVEPHGSAPRSYLQAARRY